jgi:hypothetical protein
MKEINKISFDIIEKYAMMIALGNNGGGWSTHYNEDQKNHWRNLVTNLCSDILKESKKNG